MLNSNFFLNEYDGTCSYNNLKPNCVTFIRKFEDAIKFKYVEHRLGIIAPKDLEHQLINFSDNIRFYCTINVDLLFTLVHNGFIKDNYKCQITISDTAKIHSTAIVGVEGIKVAVDIDGNRIQFKHTGGIIIGEDVEIGALSIVHRASMEMTIINDGVKIGVHCNIGHNNIIGENTVLAASVILSGSVTIGKNCWLGSGSIVKNGVSICNDTVIGTGAVVIKDIIKPGIYVGNPASFLKEKPDKWNF